MKNISKRLIHTIVTLMLLSQLAYAENITSNPQELFIPAVYSIENAWHKQDYDFTTDISNAPVPLHKTPDSNVRDNAYTSYNQTDEEEWMDNILNQLPYKNTLKYTWEIVDGEADLMGVQNLRADAGNKGITYKTSTIPLTGNLKDAHIQADIGEETALKFESEYIPVIGRVEGLQFKSSVGSDAELSLRYKKDITW